MKLKIIGSIFVSVAFIVFSSYTLSHKSDDKDVFLMHILLRALNGNHYQPQELNNNYSEEVFDLYLDRLDYQKRYLLKEDIKILAQYKHKIDDEAEKGSFEFFDKSASIYLQRLRESEAYYQEILDQPFDFEKDEVLDADWEQREFPSNKEELKENWKHLLKYQTMTRLATMIERQEDALTDGDPEIKQESYEALEAKARQKVRENYESRFKTLLKTRESDLRSMYFNALINRFDPHTRYMPPRDQADFDMRMAGEYGGIGALLSGQDGKISVSEIFPGSPCYLQGELEVDDEILKVAQGEEEPVDVVDMRVDDAVTYIRGKKGTEVRLTVKKLDGSIKVIPITRDVVKLEETYAKSIIISQEGNEKEIGYIHLPKFYENFYDPNGRRCSEDISKEIEKLEKEEVDGIILDLRNNGGGSLNEVVDMTGLFIESGPVVQVKSRDRRPSILRDEDKRVQYEGSLVILVNSFSASASEILAAAIQDYGRGIIIGTPTYGKGTVQQVLPLDRINPSLKPLGSMALTTQKFYRINGGATQIKGVEPDIILPDNYLYLEAGEKDQEYSMPWDEISPVPYQKWGVDATGFAKVIAQSNSRTSTNPRFQLIDERAKDLKEQREDQELSLNLKAHRTEKEELKQISKKYESLKEEIDGFNARTLVADQEEVNSLKEKVKSRENWLKSIRKDPYIFEAMKVVMDMK